jgi:hypothetical protein
MIGAIYAWMILSAMANTLLLIRCLRKGGSLDDTGEALEHDEGERPL